MQILDSIITGKHYKKPSRNNKTSQKQYLSAHKNNSQETLFPMDVINGLAPPGM